MIATTKNKAGRVAPADAKVDLCSSAFANESSRLCPQITSRFGGGGVNTTYKTNGKSVSKLRVQVK